MRQPDSEYVRTHSALDCSHPATWLFWFAVGSLIALGAMTVQSRGNWASLLRVGTQNPLLPRIESELGPVSPADPVGHDGQLYYLVARDPLGRGGAPAAIAALDNAGPFYRYRRILLPVLAGGFGQFSGRLTLVGMIAWLVFAMGLATVAIVLIAFDLRLPGEAAVLASINVGALLSALLLTVDALALGLALFGIALALRSRTRAAVIALALAPLAKEIYLVVPLSVGGWAWQSGHRRTAAAFLLAPLLPLTAWSVWLTYALPTAGAKAKLMGVPFAGVFEAMNYWMCCENNRLELFLAAFSVVILVTALAMLFLGGNTLLRWLVVPWVILGACSTSLVWGKPNNATRVFAILWPLVVLLVAERVTQDRLSLKGKSGARMN